MHSVVGCSNCQFLWIIKGEPKTAPCPRCGKTKPFRRRRKLAIAEEKSAAVQAPTQLLKERN